MTENISLGIDVGASGIKGGLVDIETGQMISERHRVETPNPSTPTAVAKAFKVVVKHFDWKGPVGVGFPSVVKNGITYTAANIDKSWIGTDAAQVLSDATGCPIFVQNDADLAGMAEMEFGVGAGMRGNVILVTIGSGLGTALFTNGKLVPNTELGHLYLKGDSVVAEKVASDRARKREDLSWSEWGGRFSKYLQHLEQLYWPNLIILGGGASKKFHKFEDQLKVKTKVTPAKLLNQAGIIGGALLAYRSTRVVKEKV